MKASYKIMILLTVFLIAFVARVFTNDKLSEILLADTNLVGDINADNKVNAQDYILVRKHIMGTKLTGDRLKKADVDGDNSINIKDYILIRKSIISGIPIAKPKTETVTKYTVTFDANGGSVSPTSKTYTSGSMYGELPVPSRSGYKFVGWFTKPTGVFDYEYYANNNSDLMKAFGLNEVSLKRHWYDHGRDEDKRRCSSDSVNQGTSANANTTLYAGWERESEPFTITHYWGIHAPNINDTQARYLRDAGFNLVMLSGGYYYNNHDSYVAGVGKALNKLNEYGLNAIVEGWTNPIYFDKPNETDAARENRIKQTINDFKKYSNVSEYFVGDEPPSKDWFDKIDKIMDYINTNDPGRKGTMSLLADGPHQGGDYRKDYLIPYAKNVSGNTLSFDRYVFSNNGAVDKFNFYKNLEEVYYVARDYGKIPTAIVLLTQHENFKNLTRNDIAFEASVSLAYGMKRISYFTYSVDQIDDKGFENAMLDVDHNRTTHYYDVQSVNKWLKKLGNELYNTNMVEVYGFGENYTYSYNKYDPSTSLTASQTGLIAMFENKSYLLVNTAVAENKDNVFTFNSIDNVEYYDTSTNKWAKLSNTNNDYFKIDISKKQITIKPGYCILLKGGNYWKSGGTWKKDNNGTWYFTDPNGTKVKNNWIKSKDYWYYLDSNGGLKTGWIEVDKKWYYSNSSGERQTGWIKDNNNWYYLNSNGVMQTGLITVDGKKYYLNSSGVMQTGWISYNSKWYYFDSNGSAHIGWLSDNNKWYYLDSDGTMVANQCKKIDNKEYCFDTSGAMK